MPAPPDQLHQPDQRGKVVVLVLYDSQGLVAELAASIVEGAASLPGVEVWDRPLDRADKDELAGKPAAAFSAGWSPSGGLEATLLQLVHLLIGHGMLIVGLPWTAAMNHSGSYYGATAVRKLTDLDRAQARTLGARVSECAVSLAS